MKPTTVRSLLAACAILDVALLGLLLYDYFQNESDWMVWLLAAFAVFLVVAVVLFLLAGRPEPRPGPAPAPAERPAERVTERVERVVVREVPPIPPAPIPALRAPARTILAPPRPVASGVPFTYNGYTLYTRDVTLNNGGRRTIYFFSKRKPKSGRMCAKPLGYHVGVNERTGLPFLKKGMGPDGEDLTPAAPEPAYRPQCAALTEEGQQCRNSAREGSKYCGSHFGYQPPAMSKAAAERSDTRARVRDAPDTKPATRRSWFGRRRPAA